MRLAVLLAAVLIMAPLLARASSKADELIDGAEHYRGEYRGMIGGFDPSATACDLRRIVIWECAHDAPGSVRVTLGRRRFGTYAEFMPERTAAFWRGLISPTRFEPLRVSSVHQPFLGSLADLVRRKPGAQAALLEDASMVNIPIVAYDVQGECHVGVVSSGVLSRSVVLDELYAQAGLRPTEVPPGYAGKIQSELASGSLIVGLGAEGISFSRAGLLREYRAVVGGGIVGPELMTVAQLPDAPPPWVVEVGSNPASCSGLSPDARRLRFAGLRVCSRETWHGRYGLAVDPEIWATHP